MRECQNNLSSACVQKAVLTDDVVGSLQQESTTMMEMALPVFQEKHELDPDQGIHGGLKVTAAGPGPTLQNFHSNEGLMLAQKLAGPGAQLIPTRATYLYYSTGDYALIHHDTVHAQITVLVGLDGALEPLVMFPKWGRTTNEDIEILNNLSSKDRSGFSREAPLMFGERAHGYQIEFTKNAMVAIRGRHIPHARFEQDAPARLCAVCFSLFVPSSSWLTP